MAFSFIPREEKFFELFEAQANYNVEAAKVFKDLVSKWDPNSPLFDKLRELEHEADISTHDVIDRLNRTFVTPFDREDIHELASKLDDVVDLLQSLSSRMKLYHLQNTNEDLIQLADILWESTENVKKAVTLLKNPEKAKRRLLDYCIEINRLENAGDHVLNMALGRLFSEKRDAIDIMKWKEIFEVTEAAIDKCEDVANAIEGIVVKQG